MTRERDLPESERLLARAQAIIPAQTQTLSKNKTQWARGAAPLYVHAAAARTCGTSTATATSTSRWRLGR